MIQIERNLLTKQIELTALSNEDDDAKSVTRKKHLEEEIDMLQQQLNGLNATWQAEKNELEKAKIVQGDLDVARRELKIARDKSDFGKAGELLHSTIPRLERELSDLLEDEPERQKKAKMLADSVSAEAIANMISHHTGIPVSRITGNESSKLLHMEEKLEEVRVTILHLIFFLFGLDFQNATYYLYVIL